MVEQIAGAEARIVRIDAGMIFRGCDKSTRRPRPA